MKFLERLKQFLGVCVVCRVRGYPAASHNLLDCRTFYEFRVQEHPEYLDWRKTIKYSHGVRACYYCHVPQGPNDMLHKKFVGNNSNCEYPDILAPLAYTLFSVNHLLTAAQQYFSVTWADHKSFAKWLSSPSSHGQDTNLCALFMWYGDNYSSFVE